MITLLMGPMFAGKTTELIRMLKRKARAGHEVRLYKSVLDTRYTKRPLAMSHDGMSMDCICISDAREIDPGNASVIGIEEGQFIENLVEVTESLAAQGIQVIVAALSGDANRNMFPNIAALLPKCEDVILLKAVCQTCKVDASFTRKLVPNGQLMDTGASDKYEAACRNCHLLK